MGLSVDPPVVHREVPISTALCAMESTPMLNAPYSTEALFFLSYPPSWTCIRKDRSHIFSPSNLGGPQYAQMCTLFPPLIQTSQEMVSEKSYLQIKIKKALEPHPGRISIGQVNWYQINQQGEYGLLTVLVLTLGHSGHIYIVFAAGIFPNEDMTHASYGTNLTRKRIFSGYWFLKTSPLYL